MSEQELKALKEEIKQELLKELQEPKPKRETVWSRIKKEFKEEAKLFNYEYDWTIDGRKTKQTKHFENEVFQSIGTLLRFKYKERLVNNITTDYEEVKDIVEKILNILKEKSGV